MSPSHARALVAEVHGTGPAVVLLHGQPGSAADWARVVPLLEAEFSLLVPDRPGYGRTGGPAVGFTANAKAVTDLLDAHGVDRAIVVGHSWGGGAALAAATHHPERVAGLVLVASVGPGEPIRWDDRLLAAPLVGELVAGVAIGGTGMVLGSRWVQGAAKRHLSGPALEAVRTLTRLTGAGTGTAVWRSFVAEQRALLRELGELQTGLTSITAPTVVVNGSADHIVPPDVGDMLASAIPGAKHIRLPGVGHLLTIDHPEAVASAVREVQAGAGPPSPWEPNLLEPDALEPNSPVHREQPGNQTER